MLEARRSWCLPKPRLSSSGRGSSGAARCGLTICHSLWSTAVLEMSGARPATDAAASGQTSSACATSLLNGVGVPAGVAVIASSLDKEVPSREVIAMVKACRLNVVVIDFAWIHLPLAPYRSGCCEPPRPGASGGGSPGGCHVPPARFEAHRRQGALGPEFRREDLGRSQSSVLRPRRFRRVGVGLGQEDSHRLPRR